MTKTAYQALLVFLLFSSVGGCFQREKLRKENAGFKQQVAEWQRASMPAIRARGWEERYKVETLVPGALAVALNPCRDQEGWAIDTNPCHKARENALSYGSPGIPINIELAAN